MAFEWLSKFVYPRDKEFTRGVSTFRDQSKTCILTSVIRKVPYCIYLCTGLRNSILFKKGVLQAKVSSIMTAPYDMSDVSFLFLEGLFSPSDLEVLNTTQIGNLDAPSINNYIFPFPQTKIP
jgi:hypothetical protein